MVKLVEWPGKWGTVLFGAIERGDIKCSQISLLSYHCKILQTMVGLVMFLPKNKSAMSTVFSLHLDCIFAHVFVLFSCQYLHTLNTGFQFCTRFKIFFLHCIKCTNEWNVRSRNVNFNLNVENN